MTSLRSLRANNVSLCKCKEVQQVRTARRYIFMGTFTSLRSCKAVYIVGASLSWYSSIFRAHCRVLGPQYYLTPNSIKKKLCSAKQRACNYRCILSLMIATVTLAVLIAVTSVGSLKCGTIRNSSPKLIKAVEKGANIEQLIKIYDVNVRDCDGTTALMIACWHYNIIVLQDLIRANADLNMASKVGQTALIHAALANFSDAVDLLLSHGAKPDIQDVYGETALIHASWDGYLEIVQSLIAANANVDIRERFGETALFKASYRGKTEVVTALLAAGASVNAQDITGETALHNAAVAGHSEVVEVLVRACADVRLEDGNGITPQVLAENNGHDTVAALLEPAGPLISEMSANC